MDAEQELRRGGDRVCNKQQGWNTDIKWGRLMISCGSRYRTELVSVLII